MWPIQYLLYKGFYCGIYKHIYKNVTDINVVTIKFAQEKELKFLIGNEKI